MTDHATDSRETEGCAPATGYVPPSDTAMLEWLDEHTLPEYTGAVAFKFQFRFQKPWSRRPTLIEAIQLAMREEADSHST